LQAGHSIYFAPSAGRTGAVRPRMKPIRSATRLLAIIGLMSPLWLAGCHGRGGEDEVRGSPEYIYQSARRDLDNSNWQAAVKKYEALEARFPFSDPAKQGHLDLMYAYFRNHEDESAIDQAEQFIRENPTHPRVDYAHYIKGLVYFEGGANWLERFFHADINKRPPQEARQSFQSFQTLTQQFPKSPYYADARQRMIYLRNRLADYELQVARYYMKRGAYVGAANRARGVIETYDGAPATIEALKIAAAAYRKLGIDDLAGMVDTVRAQNLPADEASRSQKSDKHWWKFWE
jgi:outer membrane protein assembly factor BamD